MVSKQSPSDHTTERGGYGLEGAFRALSRAQWQPACTLFREALSQDANRAEAWEGLAEAAWWLLDEETIFEARERAYQLYRERGDDLSAARMASWLAMDSLELSGQDAIAKGWMQMAYRLLEGHHDVPDFGWATLFHARLNLMLGDTAAACRLASRSVALARRQKLADMEAMAVSVEGLARLATGDIRRGVRCLDEASATLMAGEVRNLTAEALTLCQLMSACEQLRDYDRARQWCAKVKQVSEEYTFPALLAVCRPHYASILMWQDHWQEAEEQLDAATQELPEFMPPMVGDAIVRLAVLRWRQGRWEEAERLFEQAEDHAIARLGAAELAVSKGDLETAVDLAERHLRRISAADSLERAPAVELLVRCLAALGQITSAKEHLRELQQIANGGQDKCAAGVSGLCRGSARPERWRMGVGSKLPRGRRGLVRARPRALRGCPGKDRTRRNARQPPSNGRRVAGSRDCRRDAAAPRGRARGGARRSNGSRANAQRRLESRQSQGELTSRELEILTQLADGRSNQEIAGDLVLSIRTVERHISNIYQKLGLDGRTARTAAAAYLHRRSLKPNHY